MKKTFNIDEKLLKKAREDSGAKTDTEAVRMGLEELVRRAAGERIIALFGTEPNATDVPRRRAETIKPQRAKATSRRSEKKKHAA